MDYQKNEILGHNQTSNGQSEPQPLQGQHINDLGKIGKQAIFSQGESQDSLAPELEISEQEKLAPTDTTTPPDIKIIDQAPSDKDNQTTPLIFSPSTIQKDGDKPSEATIKTLEDIKNMTSTDPAAAVANFQTARRLYNGTDNGEKAA